MVRPRSQQLPRQLPPEIRHHLSEFEALSERYAVKRLSLIGSVLRDDFGTESDIDFVVTFARRLELPWGGQLTGLKAELRQLLGREVDLIDHNTVKRPSLLREINETAVVLVGPGQDYLPLRESDMDEDRDRRRRQDALNDIAKACDELATFSEGRSFNEYQTDRLLRAAVERQFIVIGEAMRRLRALDAGIDKHFPEAGMVIAFRNLLIHEYEHIDDEIVWDVLTNQVPELRNRIGLLLDE